MSSIEVPELREQPEMPTRELTSAEIAQVAGGMDPNYHECGGGLQPNYIPCVTWKDIYDAWVQIGQKR